MSMDATAILAFGVAFPEGFEFPWGAGDFDEWLAKQHGVSVPAVSYCEETKPRFEEFWKQKREIEAKCPVELVTHCSYDYPQYMLAVKDRILRADWGESKDPSELLRCNTQDEANKLHKFCSTYGIQMPKAPSWLVCALWG